MSWSSRLLLELRKSDLVLRFALQVEQINSEPARQGYIAASDSLIGDPIIAGVRCQGATLTPVAWTTTIGTFEIDLAGDISSLLQSVTRGTIVSVWIGVFGWELSQFERILIGQVQQVSGRRPGYKLTCLDLLSALRQRVTYTAAQLALFYTLDPPQETTLAAAYAIGDTEIEVASTTSFSRETGGRGGLLVASASGDPFLLLWDGTATSPTRFTLAEPSDEHHGTLRIAASATTTTITEVTFLEGHPMDVARKVLCSVQGASANGEYDTYPAGWGLGIPYSWIDHTDTNTFKDILTTTSGYNIEVVVTEPVDGPLGWLSDVLARFGAFLTMRQGCLTVRCGTPSLDYSSGAIAPVLDVTDDDFEEVEWEAWDQDQPVEYGNVTAYTYGSDASAGTEDYPTLPAATRKEYDAKEYVFNATSAIATEIAQRLSEARRIPERLRMTCRGLYLAQLTPGDKVSISSSLVSGRTTATLQGYSRTTALVVAVRPDWSGGRVYLEVVVYPTSGDAFP